MHRTKKHFASVKYSSEITSHNFEGTLTPQGISGAEDQAIDHMVENCNNRPQRTWLGLGTGWKDHQGLQKVEIE